MASREAVHRAWAEALFELAEQAGQLEEFEAELEAIAELFGELPELKIFATTPRIRVEQKQELVKTVFEGKVAPLVFNSLMLMASRRRLAEVPGVASAFTAMVDKAKGRERVRVISAIELEDSSREAISKAVGDRLSKTIILDERVDPSLVGGLIIEYGDTRIDGSIRRRLRTFLRAAKDRAPTRALVS